MTKCKRYILILVYLGLSIFAQGQHAIENLDACRFTLQTPTDTIQFIKINRDLDTPKPTLIFCQGSLPVPLVIKFKEGDTIMDIQTFSRQKVKPLYLF